jgi:pimeloyl-ACP methyl ester carboxylesterase
MKPKLLLLHGALGSKKQFSRIKAALKNDFDVLSFDFAGHGDNTNEAEFTMDEFAQNIINFLDEKRIESIDVFGYSMGGYAALTAAASFSDRINRIITLGTKFNWTPESAEKEVRMLNPDKIEEKVPRFAAKLKAEHSNDWKEVMNKTARMMLGLGNGQGLTNASLASIGHKVSIGIGSLDNMASVEESQNAAAVLPNGTFHMLEGVEHPIEKVGIEELRNYLNSRLK